MKFSPQQFAQAFVAVATEQPERCGEVVRRAAETLRHFEKEGQLHQFIPAIENEWKKKTGAKKFTVTSALPITTALAAALGTKEGDVVEAKLDQNLIAGVVIKENETRILDLSLRSRVQKLFEIQS